MILHFLMSTRPIDINLEQEKSVTTNTDDNSQLKDSKNEQDENQSIIARQEIQEYIQEKKKIYDNLIEFLENNDSNEKDFQNLITILSQQKQEENPEKLKMLFRLIVNISNNYRNKALFEKIYQIIEYYENQIILFISNIEIFHIFESNKKLLLFLFKKGIITIDNTIFNILFS